MVKPTGDPINAKVGAWTQKEMAHAEEHWRRQFRGEARVKEDTAITREDIANNNLVTKIAIVLLCFSLCGACTFIASTAGNEDAPQKTNVIPVKNREMVRRIWIQV